MGAWIEIRILQHRQQNDCVAPLVGAWIEIDPLKLNLSDKIVAPLVGAWIEIITFTNGYST